MNNKIKIGIVIFAALGLNQAHAESDWNTSNFGSMLVAQGGRNGTQASYGSMEENRGPKEIRDDTLSFSPETGVLGYTGANSKYQARAVTGVGIDLNVMPWMMSHPDAYLGVSTGAFYSHLGSADADMFGNGDINNVTGAGGANSILIPSDLKLGYNLSPAFRISIHGGGNIVYRSQAGAMTLNSESNPGASAWSINPNAGADFEVQVARYLNVIARPDVTVVAGNSVFMGTIGVSITPSI